MIRDLDVRFHYESGHFLGVISHLDGDELERVRVELVSDEALDTSLIEGETLNWDSLQSSVRRELGSASDNQKASPAERGVAEVLVDAYRNFDAELTMDALFRWHGMLMQGRTGLQDIGRFRTGIEPIQIVSGPDYDPGVHYVTPPSDGILVEMEGFIRWLNGSRKAMPALGRAAIAHIYFEAIHPFEDGNGRLGRVIAELSLSQSVGRSVLFAFSQAINARRRAYYDQLGKGNRTLKVNEWVSYFATTVLDARERARSVFAFVVEKGKFFERFSGLLNQRQEKVLSRMFAAGPSGFAGGLSAGNYMSIAKSTVSTTTRNLQSLVEIGALRKTGQKRHTRYWLVLPGYPDPEV